MDLEVL